jgi:hypothetical protein
LPTQTRHAELVSASIVPHRRLAGIKDQPGSRVFPQAMGHVEKWTLKQVQGDGSYWFSGDELE